jgi:hypothetical protein
VEENYEVITDRAFAVGEAGANIKAKEVITNHKLQSSNLKVQRI